MAGTMSGFWVGTSGLQSSQYALNTTAHNITNAGTEGYSRQQILLSDVAYLNLGNTAVGRNKSGLGTKVADVRLIRDNFVDKAYRKELGREQFYQTKYDVVAEIQNYFGELESSSFRDTMQGLWTSAQELQKETNSIVTRSSYIASAVTFVEQANQIYKQLTTYQKKLDDEITDQVKRINELAQDIFDLNYKITMIEAGNIESANDYRDQRDKDLDELSSLISISYYENDTGQVDVYAEHRTLVSMDRVYKMGTKEASKECDYLIPCWEDDKSNVFNMHYEVSKDPLLTANPGIITLPNAESQTDVGSLKGLIMSRGDYIANYTNVPIAPKAPKIPVPSDYEGGITGQAYQDAMTQYQQDYQIYNQEYAQYTKEKAYYNTYLEPYTVNNILAEFDQLIHGVVTTINDILCPNKTITIQDPDNPGQSKTIQVLDTETAGYGMGEGNQVQGQELFKRVNVSRYKDPVQVTLADENGNPLLDGSGNPITMMVQEYNDESSGNYLDLYSMGNLEVNDELIKNPSLLGLSNLQGEELQNVADRLIKIWTEDFTTLNPNSLVTNDFMGYYKEFIGEFANKGKTYSGIAESQRQAVTELHAQRQSVVGVSTDEELSNLIRFQQGFNASSRYFTVVSEMVEHLINKLG